MINNNRFEKNEKNNIEAKVVGSLSIYFWHSSFININSYHQPGVEAGKKAAGDILDLESKIVVFINENSVFAHSVEAIAKGINAVGEKEKVFLICQHLSAQAERSIRKTASSSLDSVSFQAV